LYDETWCLYDGQLIDDYIYSALSNFKEGVRILSFSDSCHSGTVIKNLIPQGISKMNKSEIKLPKYGNVNPITSNIDKKHNSVLKFAPMNVLIGTYNKNKEFYVGQRNNAPKVDSKKDVKASTILISGCQDPQTSAAPFGLDNSLFTHILLQVWNKGSFNGNYKSFCDEIKNNLPEDQIPHYFTIGIENQVFEKQKPFTI
jgi:metacaspase-1